VPFVR
jgi:hypothetical protein